MKNPQDAAENIYKNGCCAFVYLWCLGFEVDNSEALRMVQKAIEKGWIYPDCTVDWIKWGKALTGRNIDIEKVNITTIANIKERTPVLYSINGKTGHWVGVENGKIIFNPLSYSKNVKEGRPISMRKIKIVGVVA